MTGVLSRRDQDTERWHKEGAGGQLQAKDSDLRRNQPCWYADLRLQASRTGRDKFLFFKPLRRWRLVAFLAHRYTLSLTVFLCSSWDSVTLTPSAQLPRQRGIFLSRCSADSWRPWRISVTRVSLMRQTQSNFRTAVISLATYWNYVCKSWCYLAGTTTVIPVR